MLKDILKSTKRKVQFGLAKVNPVTAIGRTVDNYRLNEANDLTKSAINKTGGFFAAGNTKLGDPRSRGYDDRVKQQQKDLLRESGKTMQSVSENNKKRLERLQNIK
jgi:hypothetical protein